MAHHDEYQHWPFLSQEEFDLVCAFFDQKYIGATLGPTRKAFKVRCRRIATTGGSYIEILRLLHPPDDADDLSLALKMLGSGMPSHEPTDMEMEVDTAEEDGDQEALRLKSVTYKGAQRSHGPPGYSQHSHQPYVTYEFHRHPTYMIPTLWFTLHDLPMGEPAFDLDAVYRYLVPLEYKSKLRAAGVTGGISAAPHPVTDVPAFFIHPCQTKEAMECFDCSAEDYLMVWVGLVGSCVGLWIPPEMAQKRP